MEDVLIMRDGAEVRTVEELREKADASSLLWHSRTGSLLAWLIKISRAAEAEEVARVDPDDPDLVRAVAGILGVSGMSGEDPAVQDRLARVRHLTSTALDDTPLQNSQHVAFCQEELDDLIAKGTRTVYLFGDCFAVPADYQNIRYVGVNNPRVELYGGTPPAQPASVAIPEGVTHVGDSAFRKHGDRFSGVTIPDSVRCIGENAFRDCSALTSVVIPDSVRICAKITCQTRSCTIFGFWGTMM